ncbi:MAG: hypothetical protein M5U12_19240 [Verrucomicrobia bacterium]|nr:hypothetical protein [Verrucomicrobiota bacterium]
MKKLPTAFGPARDAWQTLALRDEAAVSEAIELELAALHEAQQAETERMRRQALLWKLLAWLIALAFFIAAAWMLAWLLRTAPAADLSSPACASRPLSWLPDSDLHHILDSARATIAVSNRVFLGGVVTCPLSIR